MKYNLKIDLYNKKEREQNTKKRIVLWNLFVSKLARPHKCDIYPHCLFLKTISIKLTRAGASVFDGKIELISKV